MTQVFMRLRDRLEIDWPGGEHLIQHDETLRVTDAVVMTDATQLAPLLLQTLCVEDHLGGAKANPVISPPRAEATAMLAGHQARRHAKERAPFDDHEHLVIGRGVLEREGVEIRSRHV